MESKIVQFVQILKAKTQDNKNTFIQQKEAKRKASSRKPKTFRKAHLKVEIKTRNKEEILLKLLSTKTITSQSKKARNTFCKFVPNKKWKLNKTQMCSKVLSIMKRQFGKLW